jgi:N-acetylglucosamine malate deacetylase 2
MRDEQLAGWLASPDRRRVAVVVAHPDDEVLGCGALLARLARTRVIHVTDGAPRDGHDAARHGFASPASYAAARAAEARAALALAGVPSGAVETLGVADQQASLHLEPVVRELVERLADVDLVLTHAFEGGHSDHDAVAFAVHRACAQRPRRPQLIEMPFYHSGPGGWVRQRFLPRPDAGVEHVVPLDDATRDLKARMIAAHRSQADTLRDFDLTAERYRRAPAYRFTHRPAVDALLYEQHGWNLDWPSWVERVRKAEAPPA